MAGDHGGGQASRDQRERHMKGKYDVVADASWPNAVESLACLYVGEGGWMSSKAAVNPENVQLPPGKRGDRGVCLC